MEHFIESRLYPNADVWRFYSIEEAEKHESSCPNWKYVLEDFKKIFGKIWEDKKDIRYFYNDVPVYHEYRVIGLEDNNAWADYYWILEDKNGLRRYELANMSEFYEGIKQ